MTIINLQQAPEKSTKERFEEWDFESMSVQMESKVRMMQQIFASMERPDDALTLEYDGIHGLEYFLREVGDFICEMSECASYFRHKRHDAERALKGEL